jgi:hypothetical protein
MTIDSGIRGRSKGQELRLGNLKKFYEARGQTVELMVVEQAVGTYFWPHQPEEDDGDAPGQACTISRNRSGLAALRRKQREQLESKDREEGETKH